MPVDTHLRSTPDIRAVPVLQALHAASISFNLIVVFPVEVRGSICDMWFLFFAITEWAIENETRSALADRFEVVGVKGTNCTRATGRWVTGVSQTLPVRSTKMTCGAVPVDNTLEAQATAP